MYHGVNKGGGGVVGWNNAAGVSATLEEAFESTCGNEGIVCQDAEDPEGGTMVATAALDPGSGGLIWGRADPEAMARRTVAMSQMASMLRDLDRNRVYETAIQTCISRFMQKYERAPIALDIGTGSGLLAMLCARHGAEHVFACEMYDTMAQIATCNVTNNGLSDTITVIPAKSSDIDGLPITPDIIVSELLDSALLGEAVILAHGDALSRLMSTGEDGGASGLEEDIENRVVPNRATIFGSLIESEEISHTRTTSGIQYGGMTPYRSEGAAGCVGGSPLVPLHWSQTEARGGRLLSSSHALSSFLFYMKDHPIQPSSVEIEATSAGVVSGVLLWWETMLLSRELDPKEEIKYSTAPKAQNWQDHWVQVVHALPSPIEVREGDIVVVDLHHDNMHIWLNVSKKESTPAVSKRKFSESFSSSPKEENSDEEHSEDGTCEAASCTCGWHMLCGPERLQVLNDKNTFSKWEEVLKENLLSSVTTSQGPAVVVDLSDGSMLSMIAGKLLQSTLGVSLEDRVKIVSLERKMFSRLFAGQLFEANGLSDVAFTVESVDEVALELEPERDSAQDEGNETKSDDLEQPHGMINVLLCECYFYQLHSQPTWAAISYLYMRNSLASYIAPDALILPARAKIMCAAIHLPHLYRNHGLVDVVEGFDHSALDEVQGEWHSHMYPYKIGDYEYQLLSEPIILGVIDYVNPMGPGDDALEHNSENPLLCAARCDAVAVWVDYDLNVAGDVSIKQCAEGKFLYYSKINIKFFESPVDVSDENVLETRLVCSSRFDYGSSDFEYNFELMKL